MIFLPLSWSSVIPPPTLPHFVWEGSSVPFVGYVLFPFIRCLHSACLLSVPLRVMLFNS